MAEEHPNLRVAAMARMFVRAVADESRVALEARGFSDLRPVHNHVFIQVYAGGARITDMAERAGVTKQAVTLMVDYLEARGYVERVADPDDRRAKLVQLTERGREAADAALQAAEELDRRWAGVVGKRRVDELKKTLWELISSVRKE